MPVPDLPIKCSTSALEIPFPSCKKLGPVVFILARSPWIKRLKVNFEGAFFFVYFHKLPRMVSK